MPSIKHRESTINDHCNGHHPTRGMGNRMKKILLFLCLLTASAHIFAQDAQSDADQIIKALNNYIEGRNNSDIARLASAFHKQADLRSRDPKTGNLAIWSSADYVKNFTPGKKLGCTGRIVSVDVAGSAAQAKVRLRCAEKNYADYINLLKIGDDWVIASKIFSLYPVRKKVLFIITSHDKLGDSGKKTGFHFGEAAQAYKPFRDAGYDVDFASPKGGKSHHYGADLNNETDAWFARDADATDKLSNALKLSEIDPEAYEAVYFVGGHGVIWDLANDSASETIARTVYENGGVVGAVCHGPAALVNVRLSDGRYLVQGKKLTSFTDQEEREIKLESVVPFLTQTELEKRGGIFETAPNWQPNVQSDQRLVTGQNPASTTKMAKEMIRLLRASEAKP